MKKMVIITIALGVSTLSAGMFDSIASNLVNATTNSAEKKVDNTLSVHSSRVELGKRRVPPSSSGSKTATSIKLGTPDSSLIELTDCTNLKLTNIMLGYDGTYTFKNGFKTEKRTGFIKREKGKVSHSCVLPSLNPGQSVYLEVDAKKFKALGNSNDWSMQCMKSANPDAGALENEYPREGFLSKKEMMLHCGNSEGVKECAKGSNSTRAGAWKKKLNKAGKKMFSLKAIKSPLAANGGEKVYCQYYNSDSGKSLFAFEYIRTKH
ncbi:MAG: hypothetical protein ACI9TV_002838 [Sulfurimonas sp.]|jgi:hypothetical protein|uniref:hypothetical protein n=1 Tax=Sulfurimonas sp. TaxID=2022749 RepID=UPI0039E665A7